MRKDSVNKEKNSIEESNPLDEDCDTDNAELRNQESAHDILIASYILIYITICVECWEKFMYKLYSVFDYCNILSNYYRGLPSC